MHGDDGESRRAAEVAHAPPRVTVRAGSPVGWVCTSRTPVKDRHLRSNPYVAVSYWSPDNDTVYAECRAAWVDSQEEKDGVWELFTTTPPPLGYDLSGYGTPRSPEFTPLRLDPHRVQVVLGQEYPFGDLVGRIWRRHPAE